ncbi:MAG: hypothetical protein ACYS22_00770 [Planctomycetota bacterium]
MAQQRVVATYHSLAAAGRAIERVRERGVTHDHISVVLSESLKKAHHLETDDRRMKLAEGTAKGAVLGGALGAFLGGTVATTVAATGGVIFAGPVGAIIAGLGLAGGVIGGLTGLGLGESEAEEMAEKLLGDDAVLIAVDVDPKRADVVRKALAVEAVHQFAPE